MRTIQLSTAQKLLTPFSYCCFPFKNIFQNTNFLDLKGFLGYPSGYLRLSAVILSIHPFLDGNGRLSRLLASLLLLKNGYSWIQYVSFEHEIENRKSESYKVLMDTQKNRPGENVTQWLIFFINCLNNIQSNLVLKLEESKKSIEKLTPREQRISFNFLNHPGCSSGDISTKLDIPLPTVKKTLVELLYKKAITKEGIGRATGYCSI